MLALPGSLLWVFLLVYFGSGQNLDRSEADRLDSWSRGQDELAGNYSTVQKDEEEKENKIHVAAGEDPEKTLQQDNDELNSLTNKTSSPLSDNSWEFNRTTSRNFRRRPTNGTTNAFNATELPTISQERRNSYLSIAERRRYYNRTRVQPKRLLETELDQHETTNRLSSSTETLLVNEIRVVKKPIATDPPNREAIADKNLTNNQRASVSSRGNETHGKPQTTRQSVIQSQYQFGQKLNLRKSGSRAQDVQEERLKKKKEKGRIELAVENSTNRLYKSYPTQSTKLIKVDKSLWATTATPRADADHENLVVHSYGNGTVLEKLVDYITVNNSEKVFFDVTSDDADVENKNRTIVPLPSTTFRPLALSNLNATAEDDPAKYVTADEERIKEAYAEEIVRSSGAATENVFTSETLQPTTEVVPTIRRPTALLNATQSATERPVTTPANGRSGKFSDYDVTTPSIVSASGSDKGHRKGTPLVKAISRGPDRTSTTRPVQSDANMSMTAVLQTETRRKMVFPSTPSGEENATKAEDYPLTIELNENNKRVLSEMFQVVTTSEPKRTTTKGETTTRPPKLHNASKNEPSTTNPTTVSTTSTTTSPPTTLPLPSPDVTADTPQVLPPDDYPDDHKAQGTRFSTKFYVAPNKTQVIKVVEDDENEPEGADPGGGRSPGAAIYVLAAFGLIPLLLALVFGAKFMMQRNQTEYECESDAKSDISANEAQIKDGKKKKGSTDLKKSPSNVTTITLVTTTRLPRVQHWENCEKQGNRSWEVPRSKLQLKTILGQGNFGQVWKAEVEDMVGHEGVTRLVAVKTVKEGATEKEHAEFIKELEIMQQIGSHPNIVTLLGCCTDQEPYYLIMEYVKYGKLLTYLREHRVNENYYNFSKNSDALTSRDLTVFAYCVARGMEYLASRGIIHRDLAARNVLVDHNKLCKIADFGMSRSVRDFENGQVYEERQQKGALPIRWMAPESLVYSVFTCKSDVWSFGIVMWEIVTLGSTPYPNMGAREVMKKVRDGYRLERPSHCKPEFYRLISHCWAHDPNKRPDFSELRQDLSCLLDNPTKDGLYVDLDRFAIDNSFHVSSKTNDFRLLERNDFKTLQRLGDWDNKDWPEDMKKMRTKRGRNNGKGTVMLTGQGSFTVNSRILEKEFKIN